MIIIFLILIPFILIFLKLIILFIVHKSGKISYDGFKAAGFAYDANKDIFYSTLNAWQKNFGYSHLYDVLAPIFRMIIDTESIRFYYDNKNWLISFWKGQYGIVTGGEVGIYNTKEQKVNKKTVYIPASNDDMLDMCFVLYKKDKEIMKACAKHWWLAIFKLGMFSKPKDLSMKIKIRFKEEQMLEAFLKAFKKLGYHDKDFKVCDRTFIFTFKKPKTKKAWTRSWLSDHITQCLNKKNVNLYNTLLADSVDNNKVDDSKNNQEKLVKIKDLVPKILQNSDNMDITKKVNYEKMINEDNVVLLKSCLSPHKEQSYVKKVR